MSRHGLHNIHYRRFRSHFHYDTIFSSCLIPVNWSKLNMVISINLHQITLHSNRNTIHTHPSMYTHIHIHMHGHTYTHTYTYTHMHAHTHTCTHMDTQPCTHKHTHTHVYTDTHTHTSIHTQNPYSLHIKVQASYSKPWSVLKMFCFCRILQTQ